MTIQFEWHFDDNEGPREERDTAYIIGVLSWVTRLVAYLGARLSRPYQALLMASQRRLYAGLIRVAPWLFAEGQPGVITPRFNWRTAATNLIESTRIFNLLTYIWRRAVDNLGWPSWIVSLKARISAHLANHRPVYLTGSQRRLHAAVAWTRPWLCPDAQPESVAPSFNLWAKTGNIIQSSPMVSLLSRINARLGYDPGLEWLTPSQRRSHAAVARTKPWLCPDPPPESGAPSFN